VDTCRQHDRLNTGTAARNGCAQTSRPESYVHSERKHSRCDASRSNRATPNGCHQPRLANRKANPSQATVSFGRRGDTRLHRDQATAAPHTATNPPSNDGKPGSAKRRRSWGEFTRVCTQAQETCPMLSLWWRRRGHECRACAHLRRATSEVTSHTTRRALAAQPTLCSNKSQSDAKDDSVALTTRPTAAELAGLSITRGRRRKATHPRGAGDTDPGRLT
jgi:hypothetical protein